MKLKMVHAGNKVKYTRAAFVKNNSVYSWECGQVCREIDMEKKLKLD